MVFKGEVHDQHGLLLLWCFEEEDEDLLQFYPFPYATVEHATLFYLDGNVDNRFHQMPIIPSQKNGRKTDIWACGQLIPIPVGWAHVFLDEPSMGQAYRHMIQLMLDVLPAQCQKLQPFVDGLAYACGTSEPGGQPPISALSSMWRKVPYTKIALTVATAAWEGHTAGTSRKSPPPTEQAVNGVGLNGAKAQLPGSSKTSRPQARAALGGDNRMQTPQGAVSGVQGLTSTTPVLQLAPELASFLSTIFQAQADAQMAQANATNANFIAFHTATAQALAGKSGDKDSKLTAAKQWILQACAGKLVLDEFEAEAVYWDMAIEGGTADAIGRILQKGLKPIPLSPHKTNIHVTPQLIATIQSLNFSSHGDKTYAGCTKGITIFLTPWRTAEEINEDLAED